MNSSGSIASTSSKRTLVASSEADADYAPAKRVKATPLAASKVDGVAALLALTPYNILQSSKDDLASIIVAAQKTLRDPSATKATAPPVDMTKLVSNQVSLLS